ncbi:MAG: NAD(P)H-hydrate dehydratase, partial [Candidatus Heimdallarchaeota archaeon]
MSSNYYEHLPLVVTAKEIAAMDRKTIEELGIPGIVLMENAGRKVVSVIRKMLGTVKDKKVAIFCGKGNNGGDGYVVARYLSSMGAQLTVLLAGESQQVKGDAAQNLNLLSKLGIPVLPISLSEHAEGVFGAHLIVDALLGTGVSGPVKGLIADIVDLINGQRAPKVAIDLPTGLESDTGAISGACVKADATVTMGHIKRGLLFSPGREHAGRVFVANIGIPQQVSRQIGVRCFQLRAKYIQNVLPIRPLNMFKNRCGQVFLLAGSVGLTGAATLSSEATLRIGAGMALLGIPKSLNSIVEERLTEVMTLPLPETDSQSISYEAKQQISDKFQWTDVLAIGPGLTTHAHSVKLVNWVLDKFDKPIVLDADAINCLRDEADILKRAKGTLILTPHPGELSRIIGSSTKDILANPVEIVKDTAKKLNVILVLKGAPTVVGSPDGYTFINSTGNPGMATAGMGDVLTGVIAGLVAQGMSPLDGALAGVYLHGL